MLYNQISIKTQNAVTKNQYITRTASYSLVFICWKKSTSHEAAQPKNINARNKIQNMCYYFLIYLNITSLSQEAKQVYPFFLLFLYILISLIDRRAWLERGGGVTYPSLLYHLFSLPLVTYTYILIFGYLDIRIPYPICLPVCHIL